MDWKENIRTDYKKKYYRPLIIDYFEEQITEKWISYDNDYIGVKELTMEPKQTVVIHDKVAFGCVVIQGHGKFGIYDAEAAIMLRYGQISSDEFFVSEQKAKDGIKITNNSSAEPMVILKHFGPNHPDMP